jgi:hypothetical protein
VTATVTKRKKSNNLYFNIRHGSMGLWVYILSLDAVYFKPKQDDQSLELTGDNYILLPIKKNGEVAKDNNGNTIYSLTIDEMQNHKKDIILFWEIPNRFYTDINIKLSGMVVKLGEGSTGRIRDGVPYTSPAPVLEIVGDCKLEWTGLDKEGKTVGQVINYIYADENWTITQK